MARTIFRVRKGNFQLQDGSINLVRFLVLAALFILAIALLTNEMVVASGSAFALWYAVKRLWKIR